MANMASNELSESLYDAFERAGIEAEMLFLCSESYNNPSLRWIPHYNEYFPTWLKENWGMTVKVLPPLLGDARPMLSMFTRWHLISYEDEELLLMFKLKYG